MGVLLSNQIVGFIEKRLRYISTVDRRIVLEVLEDAKNYFCESKTREEFS